MQTVIIGLGKMGKNIALHLLEQKVRVVAYNRSRASVDEMVTAGAVGAYSLSEIPGRFSERSILVILYLLSGSPVEEVLFGTRGRSGSLEIDQPRELIQKGLADILPKGSIIIDGGNSFYKDSQRRFEILKNRGLNFLDMGTSGGLEGARNGACLMVGGDKLIYDQVKPLLEKIAVPGGVDYFGPTGAGHFVKMVHNGIEYALVQAFGEGFAVLEKSEFKLDLAKVAEIYSRGSVIRGWIVELLARALKKDPQLESFTGNVGRGETGTWTVETAKKMGVEIPGIEVALNERQKSLTSPSFSSKVISALRREWGGHGEGNGKNP